MILFIFRCIFWFVICFLIFTYSLRFIYPGYFNNYKLSIIFGAPRAGKTTLLTKLAIKYYKAGYLVYSNVRVPHTVYFDPRDLTSKVPLPGSIVLIDEAGIIYDNRDYKTNFQNKTLLEFYKKFGHYKLQIYLFSQTMDVDLKLRQISTESWLVKKYMGVFSVARRITRRFVLNNGKDPDNIQPGIITESYDYAFPLSRDNWMVTFLPRWSGFYNSFDYDNDDYLPSKVSLHTPGEVLDDRRWFRLQLGELSLRAYKSLRTWFIYFIASSHDFQFIKMRGEKNLFRSRMGDGVHKDES